MHVQQTCNYYPYSPLATASLGADSNNSSPESDYRAFAQHHHHHHPQQQQRNHQLMDQHYQQQAHPRRQQQSYEGQYHGQEIDGGSMNGSYVSDQQRHWQQQLQQYQQQQQQQSIDGYPGPSAPPLASFAQQQQPQHRACAQPQLPASPQLARQAYPGPQPFADPTASFAPPVAGKQRAAARPKSDRRKRKAAAGAEDASAKMAKLGAAPGACDDESSERLTASMRERQRTQELNNAYGQLRRTIPCLPSDKLSKIQTVRLATKYIEFLCRVLQYNAVPEAVRHAHASPTNAVLASALEIVRSTKTTPNHVPSHEKLSYAFSVWRMDNEAAGLE